MWLVILLIYRSCVVERVSSFSRKTLLIGAWPPVDRLSTVRGGSLLTLLHYLWRSFTSSNEPYTVRDLDNNKILQKMIYSKNKWAKKESWINDIQRIKQKWQQNKKPCKTTQQNTKTTAKTKDAGREVLETKKRNVQVEMKKKIKGKKY